MERNRHLVKASKFLSYVLRHRPDSIGITLTQEGWADIEGLIAAGAKVGNRLDRQLIEEVVVSNDKRRFAISEDGRSIRAVQGHSDHRVCIHYLDKVPPETLYHGTATRFLDSIREKGLLAGSRRYVHLSQDAQTAVSVGRRHGRPIVLVIAALEMHRKGFKFHQAENGVWLTDHVPIEFTAELSDWPV
jgi:putative RNA 2'-phosphotransferase